MKHLGNQDAERAWLNALSNVSAVSTEDGLRMVEASRLTPEDFSGPALGDLFRASSDFLRRGVELELISLEAALVASTAVKSAGGRKFLASVLMPTEAFGGSAAEHARIIGDASLRRRSANALRGLITALQDPSLDPVETIANGSRAWQGFANQTPGLGTAEQDVFRLSEMLDAAQKNRRELVIDTGVEALDKEIGGLQPGVLTLVGALPGVGKSSLIATLVRNVANSGRKVGLFSLEDERIWLARRLLSFESGVPLFLLATKPLTTAQKQQVDEAGEGVYKTLQNVVLDDRPGLTPAEVAATARDMILNHGVKAVFVDHLGEMRLPRGERYDLDIADALAAMRDVAKRHNVPVVVASHVRRRQGLGIEQAPSLTDFANSSAPERMARVALGLSKPWDDCLRVTVLKQTNGRSGQDIDLAMVPFAAMVNSKAVATAPVRRE